MNYYLVDYENVHGNGFVGIESLYDKDHVIVFYSEYADSIPIELHFKINASSAKYEFRKVSVGPKNALDFQLCSHLGYLASYASRWKKITSIYIVSNDVGFNVLIDYWKKYGISVYQVGNLAKEPIKQECKPLEIEEPGALAKSLLDMVLDKSIASKIILFAGNAQDSNTLNVFLTRMYNNDMTKAGEIYRAVKKTIGNPSFASSAVESLSV